MEMITRHFGGKAKDYPVYTVAEAREKGVPFLDEWVLAQAGDWVRTDDDWVTLCHKRTRAMRRKVMSDFYTFTFCRRVITIHRKTGEVKSQELLFEPYRGRDKLDYTSMAQYPKTWVEAEAQRPRTRQAVKLYAALFIARNGHLEKEDWAIVGATFRKDQEIPAATFKRMLRQEKISQMVVEELRNILVGQDITEEKIINMYEEVRQKALTYKQLNVAKGVVDKYAEMMDMKPHRKDDFMALAESRLEEIEGIEDDYDQLEEAEEIRRLDTGAREEDMPELPVSD
jgi:hypothetical protein